ncbi:hypothetical protein [Streptomyces chartreusis]|uniref:hypothetical protein n=1 Tax=Streptomyces chartreusis TaxID=1969 RepID=UPI0033C0BAF9
MDPDIGIRAAIEEHWRASERGDIDGEHAVCAEDAILDYRSRASDSGAALRSRHNAAGTPPIGTSSSAESWAAVTCW